MEPPGHVRGMLLCHAGPHRLAFHAHEVASIASPSGHAAASARRAFHETEGSARVLVSASAGQWAWMRWKSTRSRTGCCPRRR